MHERTVVRCSRRAEVCFDGTLQECGPCWLGVNVGRAIKGMERCAGACCVLKQRSYTWPAQAQRSHLPSQQTGTSSSSRCSRLLQQRMPQHSVMYTTAASVGQQGATTGVHAHTHTNTHTYTQTHTHTSTRTYMRAHTHMRTRAHTHAHAYAHTRSARDGLCLFFSVASDASPLVIFYQMFLNTVYAPSRPICCAYACPGNVP